MGGTSNQTADTVILVESDWNPQADLQAIESHVHRSFPWHLRFPARKQCGLEENTKRGAGDEAVDEATLVHEREYNKVLSEDRAYRIGQTKPVLMVRLLCACPWDAGLLKRLGGRILRAVDREGRVRRWMGLTVHCIV